ncbi:hypothetical protein GK047_05625 [Paenibacillus sp. SYP-B3998]|uniref:Photosynthesis system II assembly factor Ycf48/Hcf136-like domain-containing protein n=1 Tax=Paenibacillus sp. SYP-B3998 TaxID=2678564 RepID=A0A6G3ZTF4_9BACL|nr:hypothetical protein [Paenibacillus sp. SYP-B3998]NEW05496.1 hypothetical protein [Paenibacillus sp. SYP-B3998]
MALQSTKKLLVLLLLLLCAGCFYKEVSVTLRTETASPKQTMKMVFSITAGVDITVDSQSDEAPEIYKRPNKAITFVNELQGYGVTSQNNDLLIMETKDRGQTWRKVSSFTNTAASSSLSFLDVNTGWLLTKDSIDNKAKLQLTSDGGQTWEVIARDLPDLSGLNGTPVLRFFDRQNGLIAAKGNQDMLLLRTQDGGLTWTPASRVALPKEGTGVFTFISSTSGWYVAQGKKGDLSNVLYRMTDGETWQEIGKLPALFKPQVITFLNSEEGWLLMHSAEQGELARWMLLRTEDAGGTWSQHEFPETFRLLATDVQMSFTSSENGWLLGANRLWVTEDGGLTWKPCAP